MTRIASINHSSWKLNLICFIFAATVQHDRQQWIVIRRNIQLNEKKKDFQKPPLNLFAISTKKIKSSISVRQFLLEWSAEIDIFRMKKRASSFTI